MATATQVQHTPEELLEITDRPMPELIDGQLVERGRWDRKPMRSLHVFFASLAITSRHHRLGVVNGAQGSYQIFPDDPKKVRIPDVSFTRRERLPEGRVEEGHGKIAPDLVVEVISPNDLAVEVAAKVRDFLNAGVSLIWVANPDTNDVLIYRSDGTVALLRSGDVLDGGDILPGFQCPISELFKI